MKKKEQKKVKQAWPTDKVMEQVYAMKLWGGKEKVFYSGHGSHDPAIKNPYLDVVQRFLASFEKPLRVCDLGCGDFNIGKHLVPYTAAYVAVDIVPSLIAHNETHFVADHLSFACTNIAKEDLPAGDCAILRQVLQHLSNAEVQAIVKKLNQYRYVILTEHLPKGDFVPNQDIIAGQGIRLKKQSGIDLLAPPFYFAVRATKELLRTNLEAEKGVIVTTLYEV